MRLALILTLIAGQAVADTACPVRADLENGVRLTRLDPFFSIVQTETDEGITEARVMVRNGQPEAVSSIYAHPLAIAHRIDANGSLDLTYAGNTDALYTLPQIREWETDVTLSRDGEPMATGTYSAAITGLGDATIGECTYTVWRIRDSLTLEGMAPMLFEKSFAPDLGLVLSSIRLNEDGSPASGVFFDKITAE